MWAGAKRGRERLTPFVPSGKEIRNAKQGNAYREFRTCVLGLTLIYITGFGPIRGIRTVLSLRSLTTGLLLKPGVGFSDSGSQVPEFEFRTME